MEPIRDFDALAAHARSLPPANVIVAGADDPEVLGGALRAVREGLAYAFLVGSARAIEAQLAKEGAARGEGYEIVAADDERALLARAVELARTVPSAILLKGMVNTGSLLRAALSSEAGLRRGGALLSDVMLCPNPMRAGRPFWGVTDGGINVAPDLEGMDSILRNGLDVMRALGYPSPRVALLAANEKPSPSMPATMIAAELARRAEAGAYGDCVVEGPLAMDVAVSAEAAARKGIPSRVAGAADLLVCPNIEAGNLVAKTLYLSARLPLAHVIAGARAPILVNSRSDSAADRYHSILLAMVVARGLREGSPDARENEGRPDALAPAHGPGDAFAAAEVRAAPVILALNPGATSTKIGLFDAESERWRADLPFGAPPDASIAAELPERLRAIREELRRRGVGRSGVAAVVGRGGLLPPMRAGTYAIDEGLLETLARAPRGEHASNLGAPLAHAVAAELGAPSFIVDPVSVDELRDEARVTGWPSLRREALAHALNLRAIAHRAAAELGVPLARARLVGVHLGTGISMAAFERGRMVDLVNPRDEGPFSADRAGALPTIGLAKLVATQGWSAADCERRLGREGGLAALLGTRDLREARRRARDGEREAEVALAAMALAIAKSALGLAASLDDAPDAFFLTGGMARDEALVEDVATRLRRFAPVRVYAGEDELAALAAGALRVLGGEEDARAFETTAP